MPFVIETKPLFGNPTININEVINPGKSIKMTNGSNIGYVKVTVKPDNQNVGWQYAAEIKNKKTGKKEEVIRTEESICSGADVNDPSYSMIFRSVPLSFSDRIRFRKKKFKWIDLYPVEKK
jgi:hypothetical protein